MLKSYLNQGLIEKNIHHGQYIYDKWKVITWIKIAYHFYHWLLIQVQLFFLPVIWQLSVILYLVLGRLQSKVMVLECCRKIEQNINQWIHLNLYRQKGLHFQSQQWLNQSLIRQHFARGREIGKIVEFIELKSSCG